MTLAELERHLCDLMDQGLPVVERAVEDPDSTAEDIDRARTLARVIGEASLALGGPVGARLGEVYLIECQTTLALKIGWAVDPRRRLAVLQTGCPGDLRLLATFPGTRSDESAVRSLFAAHHLRGEWIDGAARSGALVAFRGRR